MSLPNEAAGKGVGAGLVDAVIAGARAKGVRRIMLITLEKAEWLWRFYQRIGFEITDRGPPKHGLDSNNRVQMVLQL